MKRIIVFILLMLFPVFAYGATRDVVPRADEEGSIGTAAKQWGDGRFGALTITGTGTFDGLTLGADENITLGTGTIQYDTTKGDFVSTEDIDIEQASPHIGGRDTTDNSAFQIHFNNTGDYAGWALLHGTDTGTSFNVGSANSGYPSIWVDTSYNVKIPFSNFYVRQNRIPDKVSKSFGLSDPVATDDYPIWRVPYNITIRAIHVLCVGGTNIVGGLDETDTNGLNAVAIDSDITSTAGNNANDDGSLTNPTLDVGDYLFWHTTSISGTPTSVTVTLEYTID